jgi:putative DNA primase/helicase
MSFIRIQDRACGKWASILPAIGIPKAYLANKHGPCPICGGKDRFRFDDKGGSGSFYCNACGAGSGVDLVMRVRKVEFAEARRLIEEQLPSAVVAKPKAQRGIDPAVFVDMWRAARPLNGIDPPSKYLMSRGLSFDTFPSQLRFMPRMTYHHEDKRRSEHPAMLALFVAPDAASATVHITYLDDYGRKADVPKSRKLAPGPIPPGGAVRLASSAESMGIAEGIETALSAARLFGMPVWAALSANGLMKWQPPKTVRHVTVFGDTDDSFTGQHKAYALACRLRTEGFAVDVALPEQMGTDWNDELMAVVETPVREAAE